MKSDTEIGRFICDRLAEMERRSREVIDLETKYAIKGCVYEYEWHQISRRKGTGVPMSSLFYRGGMSPREILDDVDAKRRIGEVADLLDDQDNYWCAEQAEELRWALASTWSAHPDWRPEWRQLTPAEEDLP